MDISITRKLILAFSMVVATVLVMSGVVLMSSFSHSAADVSSAAADQVQVLIERAKADTFNASSSFRGFQLTRSEASVQQIESSEADFAKDMDQARKLTAGQAKITSLLGNMTAANAAWKSDIVDRQVIVTRDPARAVEAMALAKSPTTKAAMNVFRQSAAATMEAVTALSNAESAKADAALHRMQWTLCVGAALAMALAAAMGWLLSRGIGAPVVALTGTMKRLASGDNAVEVPAIGRGDEIGDMAAAVQVFKDAAIAKLALEREAASSRELNETTRRENAQAQAAIARDQALVVEEVAAGLKALSDGELTCRLTTPFAAEYELLRADFNAAMDQLQQTMQVISGAASNIASGSGEISQASDDLSRRTEQQAASLEETAAALDEITATVRKTASGAKDAYQIVTSARTDAEHSCGVVRDTVAAMDAIEKSSGEIGQIIGVIDEIAFQTNLLALNAGVEAARAGDAGRGFAVVASEVRSLAQRSAQAAKEIKTLISSSSRQVGQGVTLVGETGKALEKIAAQVGEINLVVTEIAASAQEQATALQEVNTAVNQMDQVTQQNAAMVEQATAASTALSGEAQELGRLIGQFRLGATPAVDQPRTGRRPEKLFHAHHPAPVARGGGSTRTAVAHRLQVVEEPSWEEF
jgi:methyl-accepting chemotaxis protein